MAIALGAPGAQSSARPFGGSRLARPEFNLVMADEGQMQTHLEADNQPSSNQSSASAGSAGTSFEGSGSTPNKPKNKLKRPKGNKSHGRTKPKATVKIRSTKASVAKKNHSKRRQNTVSSRNRSASSSDARVAASAPAPDPGAATVASGSSEGPDIGPAVGADARSSQPEQSQIAATALSSRSGSRKSVRSASISSGDQTAVVQSAGPPQQGWSPRSTGTRPSQAGGRARRSLGFGQSAQQQAAVASSSKAAPLPSTKKYASKKVAGGRRPLHEDVLTFEQFQVQRLTDTLWPA